MAPVCGLIMKGTKSLSVPSCIANLSVSTATTIFSKHSQNPLFQILFSPGARPYLLKTFVCSLLQTWIGLMGSTISIGWTGFLSFQNLSFFRNFYLLYCEH